MSNESEVKTAENTANQALEYADHLYPMADENDYPENPDVNRINSSCRCAFMNGFHYAQSQTQQLREENARLREVLSEVMDKCDGVTNPPCYIDSLLFQKVKQALTP